MFPSQSDLLLEFKIGWPDNILLVLRLLAKGFEKEQ